MRRSAPFTESVQVAGRGGSHLTLGRLLPFAVDGKSQLADYLAYVKADSGDADTHVANAILGKYADMANFEYGNKAESAF